MYKDPDKKLIITVKKPESGEDHIHSIRYNAELIHVLRDSDVNGFRDFLITVGRSMPDFIMQDPNRLESMMNQLVLSIPELEDLHQDSRDWLDKNTTLGSHFVGLGLESPVSEEERQLEQQGHSDLTDDRPLHRVINLRHFAL